MKLKVAHGGLGLIYWPEKVQGQPPSSFSAVDEGAATKSSERRESPPEDFLTTQDRR